MSFRVLVCPKCGKVENPQTFDGTTCEKCGTQLVPGIVKISGNGDSPDEETTTAS